MNRRLGSYILQKEIGRGGMGVVYLAWHERLKRTVALKVLSRERVHDARALLRFQREMELIAKLDHPNIVKAHDAGEVDGEHFLVMEWLDGINLSDLVQLNGGLEVADACELVRQAAQGLQHAHEHGLVHRDVKPSNLILTRSATLKLVDLGLARLAEHGSGEHSLTGLNEMVGSVDYMAPEQGILTGSVDIRADLYSLGCSLYKLLAGKAPFGDPPFDTERKKLVAHAYEVAPKITDRRPGLPAGLVDLVERLMSKAPADRPASPAEVAALLEPFTLGSDLTRLATLYCTPPAMPFEPEPSDGADPSATTLLDKDHQGTTIPEVLDETASRAKIDVIIEPPKKPDDSLGSRTLRLLARAFRLGWDEDHSKARLAFSLGIALAGMFALLLAVGLVVWVILVILRPSTSSEPLPGIPYPLLQIRPTRMLWKEPVTSGDNYDETNRSFVVHCEGTAIFRLLDTGQFRKYDYEVTIKQTPWTGNIGIIFGAHRVRMGNNDLISLQSITIEKDFDHPERFKLVRKNEAIIESNGTIQSEMLMSSAIPTPKSGEEHRLGITVGERGLESVRWDGKKIAGLADPLAGRTIHLDDSNYHGHLGVIFNSTVAAFSKASFVLDPEPENAPERGGSDKPEAP